MLRCQLSEISPILNLHLQFLALSFRIHQDMPRCCLSQLLPPFSYVCDCWTSVSLPVSIEYAAIIARLSDNLAWNAYFRKIVTRNPQNIPHPLETMRRTS